METLFQLWDKLEDFVVATALRLQRTLSRKPKERRRVPDGSDPGLEAPPARRRKSDRRHA